MNVETSKCQQAAITGHKQTQYFKLLNRRASRRRCYVGSTAMVTRTSAGDRAQTSLPGRREVYSQTLAT